MEYDYAYFKNIADFVKEKLSFEPEVGVILGSGLGKFADTIENPTMLPYAEIPGFPVSTVASHAGKLIAGTVHGKKVICMAGRFHHYEGYDFRLLSLPIRLFKLLGVKTAIVTNAAGGVNTAYRVGDVMLIKDHIKLTSLSPIEGPNVGEFGERFFDVSDMYTKKLRDLAKSLAPDSGLRLQEGVYMYFAGPQFETPAEIRMARLLGADAVGMSTVTEALTAAHCGMPLLGMSVITNMAAGVIPDAVINHEEVGAAAAEIGDRFVRFVGEIIKAL